MEKAYSICPNISIDYAIMEQADNVLWFPQLSDGATLEPGQAYGKIMKKTTTEMP